MDSSEGRPCATRPTPHAKLSNERLSACDHDSRQRGKAANRRPVWLLSKEKLQPAQKLATNTKTASHATKANLIARSGDRCPMLRLSEPLSPASRLRKSEEMFSPFAKIGRKVGQPMRLS